MNEPRLFDPRYNLYLPSRRGSDPFKEGLGIPRVPHRAGGDDTHRVCDHLLGGPVKAPQNLYRLGNGLRGEKAGTEYAFAQARHLAILMQRVKTSSLQTRDLETD